MMTSCRMVTRPSSTHRLTSTAAEAYSVAEGIYAKTGISVPVVEVDVEALYLDPEEVKQPFTCGTPPDTQAKDHLMSVQLKPSTSP